jgi:hypothetical protein
MREHRLLQAKRNEGRRKRPGYFEVTRPNELWHMDMTSVWVAEYGWCYLNAAIDSLQPRDHRMGAGHPLPRGRGDHRRRRRGRRAPDHARHADARD